MEAFLKNKQNGLTEYCRSARHVVTMDLPFLVLVSKANVVLMTVQLVPNSPCSDVKALFAHRHSSKKDDIQFQAVFAAKSSDFGIRLVNYTPTGLYFSCNIMEQNRERPCTKTNYIPAFDSYTVQEDVVNGCRLSFQTLQGRVTDMEGACAPGELPIGTTYFNIAVCATKPKSGNQDWMDHFSPKDARWECRTHIVVDGDVVHAPCPLSSHNVSPYNPLCPISNGIESGGRTPAWADVSGTSVFDLERQQPEKMTGLIYPGPVAGVTRSGGRTPAWGIIDPYFNIAERQQPERITPFIYPRPTGFAFTYPRYASGNGHSCLLPEMVYPRYLLLT